LIALRGSFARFISAGALTAAMERVAQNDARAAEWMVHLRRDETVSELRDKAIEATRAAEDAETRATGAQSQLERLNTELATVREQLRKAVEHNADAGEAQLRQAKLDVLRSLANLASHVLGSQAAQEDPSLSQRVEFTLRREGLSIIGSSGESVPYDPALHDAQGQHVNPGSPVSVGRGGYTYDAGNETVVLAKALVSAM
jgi:molecular chaperone GrpE (heat shock protein)